MPQDQPFNKDKAEFEKVLAGRTNDPEEARYQQGLLEFVGKLAKEQGVKYPDTAAVVAKTGPGASDAAVGHAVMQDMYNKLYTVPGANIYKGPLDGFTTGQLSGFEDRLFQDDAFYHALGNAGAVQDPKEVNKLDPNQSNVLDGRNNMAFALQKPAALRNADDNKMLASIGGPQAAQTILAEKSSSWSQDQLKAMAGAATPAVADANGRYALQSILSRPDSQQNGNEQWILKQAGGRDAATQVIKTPEANLPAAQKDILKGVYTNVQTQLDGKISAPGAAPLAQTREQKLGDFTQQILVASDHKLALTGNGDILARGNPVPVNDKVEQVFDQMSKQHPDLMHAMQKDPALQKQILDQVEGKAPATPQAAPISAAPASIAPLAPAGAAPAVAKVTPPAGPPPVQQHFEETAGAPKVRAIRPEQKTDAKLSEPAAHKPEFKTAPLELGTTERSAKIIPTTIENGQLKQKFEDHAGQPEIRAIKPEGKYKPQDDIKTIQRALGVEPVTGHIGPKTEAALEKFMVRAQMTDAYKEACKKEGGGHVDGIYGSRTEAALKELKAPTELKQALKDLNDHGGLHERYSPQDVGATMAAVTADNSALKIQPAAQAPNSPGQNVGYKPPAGMKVA